MRRLSLSFLLLFYGTQMINAQSVQQSSDIFDKQWLKSGKSEMRYYFIDNAGSYSDIGSQTIELVVDRKHLSVYSSLVFYNDNTRRTDTSIADINTLKPVYHSSYTNAFELSLRYGNNISGYYMDKKTKERSIINENVKGSFFDGYIISQLVRLLPLTSGYKTSFPVYFYNPGSKSNITTMSVNEVKSSVFTSKLTGEHKVWQVTLFRGDEKNGTYYIDKDNRRMWQTDLPNEGNKRWTKIDKEADYNPIKSSFDKTAMLKMITGGNSTISGVAFLRDSRSSISVLNVQKKQFAQQGTTIMLFPYSDYYKEWQQLNKAASKKGRQIQVSQDFWDCVKTTTVYDQNGHFEFTNLMPGDYMLVTQFGYVHTNSVTRTEVVGYTDHYINGGYAGTSTDKAPVIYNWNTNESKEITLIVTIKKDGDNVSVKLKKITL